MFLVWLFSSLRVISRLMYILENMMIMLSRWQGWLEREWFSVVVTRYMEKFRTYSVAEVRYLECAALSVE